MNTQPCLSTIKTEYARLTKRERKLADYILEHFESVVTMSTTELAQNAGVVRSVIIRFCHLLGFGGYTEFKLMLSRELARNEQFGFTPFISKNDSPKEILGKIFASNIKTLHDTAEGIDKEIFTAAVDALYNAHNIYVYGIGTSAGIACDFQYRLTEIGLSAFFHRCCKYARIGAQDQGGRRGNRNIEQRKDRRDRGRACPCPRTRRKNGLRYKLSKMRACKKQRLSHSYKNRRNSVPHRGHFRTDSAHQRS